MELKWKQLFITIILLGCGFYNLIAYNQAHSMLHFTTAGVRTASPEDLSLIEKAETVITGINLPRPVNQSTPDDVNLPFETHMVKVNPQLDIEAWHIQTPSPSGIVLLFHGYGESKETLLPVAERLYGMGYDTFLVDFRGSGGSDGDQTSIGYYEAAEVDAAVQFVQSMSDDKLPLILYGQSMGGAAIMRAVSTGVVSQDGIDAIIVEAVFDEIVSTVANRFRSMGLPAFPSAQILTFWGGVQIGQPRFVHAPADYAADIQTPTLMMIGEDDPRVTVAQSERIFATLAAEKKEMLLFEGASHQSFVEYDPETWTAAVERFLSNFNFVS